MLVVSGTGRSGTSMWMQVLRAAGVPTVGEAFPRDWADTFAPANPRGFYESTLAGGINWSTNPNPVTGARLDPVDHRDVAVKVFLSGVLRSERPYLHRVLVSVRGWREFCASRRAADTLLRGTEEATDVGHLRWWLEHVATVSDAAARGYPIRFVAYEDVLADPRGTVADVLDWFGVGGEVDAAADAVSPALRTQVEPPAPPGMPAGWVEGFDALYAALRTCPDEALGFGALHAEVVEAAREQGPRPDPWAAGG